MYIDRLPFILKSVYISLIGVALIKIVCILIGVAYFTIAERKVMGAIQRRLGPNVVGFWGLLQPLADGFKLLTKELLLPTQANTKIFVLAPVMILTLSLMNWSIVPFNLYDWSEIYKYPSFFEPTLKYNWQILTEFNNFANIAYGLLFSLALSGLNVYGIIIAGWASNSKYAFLGALRSAAQMISYEVSIGLVILPVILLSGSLNFLEIIHAQSITGWYFLPLFPSVIMFFVSMIAETNRSPFDLPEAEAELVAGYNVEYSSIIFAMFFLGEYSNMLFMSTLIVILFFGGWLAPFALFTLVPASFLFALKIVIFCFLFILTRASYPRYRYDQLMDIGWKTFLPLSLGYLIFLSGVLLFFNSLPQILEINTFFYTENVLFDHSWNNSHFLKK